MLKRRNMLTALLGCAGLGMLSGCEGERDAIAGSHSEQDRSRRLFFTQQDHVIDFSFETGLGSQVGTVSGKIVGTSIVNFQFIFTSPQDFLFDNRAIITDLNGDQALFKNVGTGRAIIPLGDPDDLSLNLFGFGGPLVGTYECIDASGEHINLIGHTFPYRAIGSNPAKAGLLGTVYVEVYSS